MRRIRRYGGFFCAAARVQEKISRGNVTRGTAPKAWWNPYYNTRGRAEKPRRAGTGKDFPRIYPWLGGKTPPRGYRRKISRGYTRGRTEKHRRAGTGNDFPRIYPWERGKTPPHGYRRRFRANIPVAMRNLYPRELYFSLRL